MQKYAKFLLTVCGISCSAPTASVPNAPDVLPDVNADSQPMVDASETSVYPFTPPVELGRHTATLVDTRKVIPSSGLPEKSKALTSNNNLDVVRHSDGKVYLAWRTSLDHFASNASKIYVVSSTDENSWQFETEVAIGTDIREPRFLSFNGRLFLYISRLGNSGLSFEPKGISVIEKKADGSWSSPAEIYKPGTLTWRSKVERGKAYMVSYLGGENIYNFSGKPIFIEWLTSTNGVDWVGVNANNPVVLSGGGSETDFTFTDNGTLFAIVRNEAGDEMGWGSKVCTAPPDKIGQWSCKPDRRKYDSPLVFWHDGEVYLLGRRNVTASGAYQLDENIPQGPASTSTLDYQLDYITKPKRCSLWRVDQTTQKVAFILDLPSRGDTCFPAILPTSEQGSFAVYNYSSDIDGPDLPWNEGQKQPTFVYRHTLKFSKK